MDRDIDVRTPESISFSYELAGLGSRFLALTLDVVIQVVVFLVLVWGVVSLPQGHGVPKGSPAELRFVQNLAIAVIVFTLFMLFFGYFIVFEALWNGQTPGKRALGIRVVRDGGYPVDFGASVVRNLIRIVEAGLAFYAVSAVCALLSKENKRVGDVAAGTIVVRDARMLKPAQLVQQFREPAQSLAATAYLDPEERDIVRRFLDRRDSLAPDRRRTLAAQIAERVRSRIPQELARLDDEALLERL